MDVADREMEEKKKAFYREYGLQVEMVRMASVAAFRKVSVAGKSVAVTSGVDRRGL